MNKRKLRGNLCYCSITICFAHMHSQTCRVGQKKSRLVDLFFQQIAAWFNLLASFRRKEEKCGMSPSLPSTTLSLSLSLSLDVTHARCILRSPNIFFGDHLLLLQISCSMRRGRTDQKIAGALGGDDERTNGATERTFARMSLPAC